MDEINLQAVNTATFVFNQSLSAWAPFYPLSEAAFRSYMRKTPEDPVVLYEWSTDNGRITFAATAANAIIAYEQNPAPDDTLTLGSSIVTFVASPTGGNNVAIAPTLTGTLANLLAFLQASHDSQISRCSYAVAGFELSIAFNNTTLAGNLFAIAASTANAAVSSPTLLGAGGMITMTAPLGDLEDFVGDYSYDVRLELGSSASIVVPLFGGTITLTEGVTR